MIRKYSKKGLEKKKDKQEVTKRLHAWFISAIWNKRPHYCEECGKWLGSEPLTIFFDHLIEKNSHPELAFEEENIFLCCGNCHTAKTNGFPKPKHKQTILKAKEKYAI